MLGRLKISVLQAFTPYAEELASRFAEAGIVPARDLAVRQLIIGGELRTADAKVRLAEAWAGAEIRETYGASEVGLAAIECEVGDGMHVSEDCYLEVVDPDTGYQVPPDTPGEIVLTDLFRSAQPFVRYRTGDLTEGLSLVPCGCGRTTPRLGRIVGRRSDVLRVRGLFQSPSVVRAALAEFPEITTWRIVVDRPGNIDEVWLTVESSDAEPVSDDFDARLGKTLKGQTDLSIQIRHVPTGTIGEAPWYDDRRSF
jgi:phenylacetate-CoA ligase